MLASSAAYDSAREQRLRDFQRAMLNLLEDFDAERKRLEHVQSAMLNLLEDFAEEKARFLQMQTATLNILDDFATERQRAKTMQPAMLNILEDFAEERNRFAQVQTATLNILEDFSEEKTRSAQMQTATLNILEDSEAEKALLRHSQRAFLNILEDIELEKEKVAGAHRQIGEVNKELEEFAYAASHDLKAPLRVIDNASKWLEEDLEEHLTDETRDNMKLLRGRVGRMERLLDDLLEYSRVGRITDERFVEVISGDALMADVLALLSPPDGFIVRVSPSFLDIQVRRMPLQQILMNLVSNAIKHHHRRDGRIDVAVENRSTDYVFLVKDDGPGIPAQFHDQIFKMFQTLKPRDQVEGSGMGLALVKKNIETSGGTIALESSEGNGSIFRFTWPKQQHWIKGKAA
jgi:signal transduction histidine kinase